jgi:hypothetical protein
MVAEVAEVAGGAGERDRITGGKEVPRGSVYTLLKEVSSTETSYLNAEMREEKELLEPRERSEDRCPPFYFLFATAFFHFNEWALRELSLHLDEPSDNLQIYDN